MNSDQLIELEGAAREILIALEAEIGSLVRHLEPSRQLITPTSSHLRFPTHPVSEADRLQLRKLRLRQHQLAEAVARMEEGNYGVCASCESEIEFERLSRRPETLVCAVCAVKG